ncbi:hypothetical protein J2T13_002679 [Paenibacillus sp. DS2015]
MIWFAHLTRLTVCAGLPYCNPGAVQEINEFEIIINMTTWTVQAFTLKR